MNTKKLRLITIICLIAGLTTLYVAKIGSETAKTDNPKPDSLTGRVEISKGRITLQQGKKNILLNMLPPAGMDSLGFHPADDDTLTVKGYRNRGAFVVDTALWKGQSYTFRDSLHNAVWPGTSTWKVDQKTCIGCRLCFNNCPIYSISMVKVKGSDKALIDQSKCAGCNICIAGNDSFQGCPVKAISK